MNSALYLTRVLCISVMQVGRSSALIFVRHCLVLIYCVATINPGKLPSVLNAQFKQRKKEGISAWLIYLCLYTATSMMTSTLRQLGYIAHDVNMTDEDDIVEMLHFDHQQYLRWQHRYPHQQLAVPRVLPSTAGLTTNLI
jgi:hypothetical protein